MTKDITIGTAIECMMTMEVGHVLCVVSSIGDSYGTITDCDTGKSNTLYFANTNNTIQCGGGITQAHKYSGHIVININ